jgi:lauroyl/myristoyl acyltransferase
MTRAPSTPAAIAWYRLRLGRWAFAPRYWGSWAALAFLFVLAALPLRVSRAVGAALGLLLYAANAKRRAIARVNIALCFPELSERERRRFLRRHYVASGQAYTDLGLLAFGARQRVLGAARVHGLKPYLQLAREGRPIILLAPHLVGMNFGGAVVSSHHVTFSMYKSQRNRLINWFLNRGRMRFAARLLARDQGLRPVLRALKDGLAFYYLPDEDFGPANSVFAPFFGVPTATLATLGRLADSADAAVVPCFACITPRGYDVHLLPPLENFPSGDRVRDAARMNQAMEAGIRLAPEQYLWTFKLFRTRPAGEPALYPEKRRRRG